MLPYQNIKDWAFSVIEQLGAPPLEVIEVATANGRDSGLNALQASAHGAVDSTDTFTVTYKFDNVTVANWWVGTRAATATAVP